MRKFLYTLSFKVKNEVFIEHLYVVAVDIVEANKKIIDYAVFDLNMRYYQTNTIINLTITLNNDVVYQDDFDTRLLNDEKKDVYVT